MTQTISLLLYAKNHRDKGGDDYDYKSNRVKKITAEVINDLCHVEILSSKSYFFRFTL